MQAQIHDKTPHATDLGHDELVSIVGRARP
jgi:hypothetical protein